MVIRSRTDIIEDILRVAEQGVIKTRIMHRALLSFNQLKEYLELLTDIGLLEYSEMERKYYTTEKGRHFLTMYKEMKHMIPSKGSRATVS